jgi:hypothetical protein
MLLPQPGHMHPSRPCCAGLLRVRNNWIAPHAEVHRASDASKHGEYIEGRIV